MAKRFSRARAWAGRRYAKRGAYMARARGVYNKTGLNLSMEYMAGFVGAFVLPENEMLSIGAAAVAVAPIKGLGKVKGAGQGYLAGQIVQKWLLPKLGINIGNIMGAGNNNYPGSNII